MKIYVGNLPYQANERQLGDWFSGNGFPARSISIVVDRLSGMPRGFGFVEIHEDVASRCVLDCNGQDFLGRTLVINKAATPAESRLTPRTDFVGVSC